MKRGDVVIVAATGDYGKPRAAVIVQTDAFPARFRRDLPDDIMPVRLSERGALNRRYAAMSCSRFCLVSI